MRVVRGVDRDAQAVQARAAGGFGMEMQRLGKERADRLLDHLHVGAQSGQCRENHVAAGAANTVKPQEVLHARSLAGRRGSINPKKTARAAF
jgi:hypothetical protein